jgi:glycyl-tRNA synthetase
MEIQGEMRSAGFISDFDDSGSIGRRYARADEIGSPLAVTIDYDTLKDGTVTLRDRNTWIQERIAVRDLCRHLNEYYTKRYP